VLGQVRVLDIDTGQTPAPLIFFQGGYGTFAVPSVPEVA